MLTPPMLKSLVPNLRCAACGAESPRLQLHVFEDGEAGHVKDGVVACGACKSWYPIENELLELVKPELLYAEDYQAFVARFGERLNALGLAAAACGAGDVLPQAAQRRHFDWYAYNPDQTYNAYQHSPFWKAFDATTFKVWKAQIRPGGMLLDVGCADGRSCFPFIDCGATIVGLDISKALVRQAIARAAQHQAQASTTFLVADASVLPFREGTFESVVIYGVLHHVPNPGATCREAYRLLQPGGVYFGSENNVTVFRWAFDLLMKLRPIWREEAGDQPLISQSHIERWLDGLPATITCRSSVFVPPQLVNLLGDRHAPRMLAISDRLFTALPGLRQQGGLIVFEVRKP